MGLGTGSVDPADDPVLALSDFRPGFLRAVSECHHAGHAELPLLQQAFLLQQLLRFLFVKPFDRT